MGRLQEGRQRAALEHRLDLVFQSTPCESVPPIAGDHYASIKIARQRIGRPMEDNDLWVAATAMALGASLVTRDGDFIGIEGLAVVTPG